MTDGIGPDDPLDRAVAVLRETIPIAPGLSDRARNRARRRQVRMAGSVGMVVLLGAVGAVLGIGARGTSVTFALRAPAVRSVALIGDFTDWRSDRVQLAPAGAGLWRTTMRLRPGRYRFAYLVDHAQWRADPRAASAPDDFGRPTSVLTVVGN